MSVDMHDMHALYPGIVISKYLKTIKQCYFPFGPTISNFSGYDNIPLRQ